MTTDNDIVERLRALSRCEHSDLSVGDEAAAEIERLRGEADALHQCGIKYLGWLGVKDAENGLRKDMADPEMVDRPAPAMPNGAVAWRHPDEVPEVVPGGNAYFWVAVRRKHDGRVYSFPAQYLNAMLLCNEWSDDTERSGNRYHHGPTCEVEGSFPATGWHDAKEHGEYDCVYQPLLGDADELVAWREVADYPATTPAWNLRT